MELLTVHVNQDSLILEYLIVLNVNINVKNVLQQLLIVQLVEEIELELVVTVLMDSMMMDTAKTANPVYTTVLNVLDLVYKIVKPVKELTEKICQIYVNVMIDSMIMI